MAATRDAGALTIEAVPEGLADGQIIELRGNKPLGAVVAVGVCPMTATVMADCQPAAGDPMWQGTTWRLVGFRVPRFITTSTGEYDCRSGCVVAVNRRDRAGAPLLATTDLRLETESPTPARPAIRIEQAPPYHDGQEVALVGTDFVPYTTVRLVRCADGSCEEQAAVLVTRGATGGFTTPYVVASRHYPWNNGPIYDCLVVAHRCAIQANADGPRQAAPLALSLLPEPEPPGALVVRRGSRLDPLEDQEPVDLADGEPVRVYGPSFMSSYLWQCPPEWRSQGSLANCRLGRVGPAETAQDSLVGSLRLRRFVGRGPGRTDCATAGPCEVVMTATPSLDIVYGTGAIFFDPDRPPRRLRATVEPRRDVRAGQAITVSFRLPATVPLPALSQCGRWGGACEQLEITAVERDGRAVTVSTVAERWVGPRHEVDCAVRACVISFPAAMDGRMPLDAPINVVADPAEVIPEVHRLPPRMVR